MKKKAIIHRFDVMNRQIWTIYLLFTFIFSLSFSQTALPVKLKPFSIPEGARYVPGKLIVRFNDASSVFHAQNPFDTPSLQSKLSTLKATQTKKIFPNAKPPIAPTDKLGRKLVDLSLIYEISFEKSFSVEDAVNLLSSHEAISYAEPRYIYEPFYIPNDVLADTTGGKNGMWHLNQIEALQAWDTQRGDTNIIIAAIDAGTNLNHPDLVNTISLNHDDPIDGIDNDQDGYVDNYYGWDFGGATIDAPADNDPSLGNVHGLWVTGTIAAEADNQIGVAGVSFNCRYLAIKGSPDNNVSDIPYGYEGIVYAADYGAQIINASWGGSFKSLFGEEVVQYATINKSAAVIAAAGNSGKDQVFYPAGYQEVIGVSGSYFGDTLCCRFPGELFNTTFNYKVDVSAPGWRIKSTFAKDGYWSWDGTSAAAPVVAGATGIVMVKFPNLSGFQAAQRIRVTTDDIYQINPNHFDKLGTGRINLNRALNDPLKPSIRVTNFQVNDLDGDGYFKGGDTLTVIFDFANYLEPTQNLDIQLSIPDLMGEVIAGSFQAGIVGTEQAFSSGNSFKIKLFELIPANYKLDLRLGYSDPQGNYKDFEYIDFRVNQSWVDVKENQVFTSINSQGNFGFDDFGSNQDGLGLSFNLEPNVLFEGGFLLGNSSSKVSDRIRNNNSFRDLDFQIEEQVVILQNDQRADFVARSQFNDNGATSPLEVSITNHVYAFHRQPYQDFVILEYIIQNNSQTVLNNLYGGLFADWDIAAFEDPNTGFPTTKNIADYNYNDQFVYAYDPLGQNSRYFGLSLISAKPFRAFATTNPNNNGFDFANHDKFNALTNVPTPSTASAGISNGGEDIMQFISAGPMLIHSNETDTLTFALLANNSLMGLETATRNAKNAYQCLVLGKGPNEAFSIADSNFVAGQEIQFMDNNTGAISWNWDFGDGTQAMNQAPKHTFSQPGNYTISLHVSDGECEFTSSQIIVIDANTSIENNFTANQISLYPNPGSEQFFLEIANNQAYLLHLSLLDINGRTIWSEEVNKGAGFLKKEITLSSVPSGIYIFNVSSKDFNAFGKLMIR